jgi:hypothetical protein|tara:strand:+ start:171 stop:491 length:321 start_codon:yes stop_codon:yes gene_type:complete
MEKFICFVSGTDDAAMYPVGALRGLAVTAESTILMTFTSFRNGTADLDRDTVTLTCTADKEKDVMTAIAQKINQHPNSDGFIVLADDVAKSFVHPDLLSITIAYAS